ncbi:hypothetical protein D3C86_2024600 [compost metagenome]
MNPGLHTTLQIARTGKGGQYNDFGGGAFSLQGFRYLQPAFIRHFDVHQAYIRLKPLNDSQRLRAVSGFSCHFNIILQIQ